MIHRNVLLIALTCLAGCSESEKATEPSSAGPRRDSQARPARANIR